jgi:hypothetical protein
MIFTRAQRVPPGNQSGVQSLPEPASTGRIGIAVSMPTVTLPRHNRIAFSFCERLPALSGTGDGAYEVLIFWAAVRVARAADL